MMLQRIVHLLCNVRQRWGADCESLRLLLEPVTPGLHTRGGLMVQMRPASTVFRTVNQEMLTAMQKHHRCPSQPIADFKYHSKAFMAPYFRAWKQSTSLRASA